MKTYFVTRHPGAIEWSKQQGISVDVQVEHLDVTTIQPGDKVIGILPIHLAAQVCERGAEFYHLTVDLPSEARGKELSAQSLVRYRARLEPYLILSRPSKRSLSHV